MDSHPASVIDKLLAKYLALLSFHFLSFGKYLPCLPRRSRMKKRDLSHGGNREKIQGELQQSVQACGVLGPDSPAQIPAQLLPGRVTLSDLLHLSVSVSSLVNLDENVQITRFCGGEPGCCL